MIIGLDHEIPWAYIGAKLARDDDAAQIKFFKAFVKEMQSFGTNYQFGIQFASIRAGLTKDEMEILEELSEL